MKHSHEYFEVQAHSTKIYLPGCSTSLFSLSGSLFTIAFSITIGRVKEKKN